MEEQTEATAVLPEITDQVPMAQSTESEKTIEKDDSDVFAWANNLYQFKDKLDYDLFFFTKSGMPYKVKLAGDLTKQIAPLFIDGILDYVLKGADEGLLVRGFEEAEEESNVLQRTRVGNVDKLVEVLNFLRTQESVLETFKEEDHDLKRIRGMILRGNHAGLDGPFYVIKQMPGAKVIKGVGAWLSKDGSFEALTPATSVKIPDDNQLLILNKDLYVFSQGKLDSLFGYNAKKNAIAEKKVRAIEAQFNLSFAEGLTMQSAVKDSKALINKLQKIEPGMVKQEELMGHAEELGIDLMEDENGAIIIIDAKDLTKFINLLNDDYMESGMTGLKYEIKGKKLLKVAEEET